MPMRVHAPRHLTVLFFRRLKLFVSSNLSVGNWTGKITYTKLFITCIPNLSVHLYQYGHADNCWYTAAMKLRLSLFNDGRRQHHPVEALHCNAWDCRSLLHFQTESVFTEAGFQYKFSNVCDSTTFDEVASFQIEALAIQGRFFQMWITKCMVWLIWVNKI